MTALDRPYTLDCGCRLPEAELQRHLQTAVELLPQRLSDLARHFCCPQKRCRKLLTHRDLEALLGGKAAGKVNTHIWSAVALESRAAAPAALPHCSPGDSGGDSGSDDVIDLAASPRAAPGQAAHAAKQLATVSQLEPAAGAPQAAVQRCTELAGLLLQLHGVLVDGKLPAQAADGANGGVQGAGPRRGSGSRRAAMMQREGQEGGAQQGQGPDEGESEATPAAGSGRRRGRSSKQQTTAAPPPKKKKSWQHQNPPAWANKTRGGPSAGVGYGGDVYDNRDYGMWHIGGRGGGHGSAQRQREDAARRQQQLDEAAAGLLMQLSRRLQSWAEEVQESLEPLPLVLLAALRGGPLAPLLRLLLQNDSLMDVSGRRELYKGVFGLVATLAGSPDLLPLLLQPADSDLLKGCVPQQAQQAQQGTERSEAATAAAAGRQGREPSRGKGSAGTGPAAPVAEAVAGKGEAAAGEPAAANISCWGALQALRLQADIFRRNAEQLAAEGNEEDLQLVGALLDVSECCQRAQQAVDLWQAGTGQARAGAGQQGGEEEQQAQQRQQQPAAAADSPELRQQYLSSLKPLLFQSLPLLQGHYYRQQAATGGGLSDRLRRITKEVATLPGQLPLSWESAILAAMDEDNMGALRAVIFAPHDTPYSCGAFAFDILLQADYPNRPPQVHFLTTDGGRVRFNPNLYDNGKVCLSLLGTWNGPSWQPAQSTLLQVLVSIQSMILGTQEPFFNEPGYASMEGTTRGRSESQGYNRRIRRHTLQVAILGQLQRPPAGFEEAVRLHFRLKAGVIKEQVRQWVREDSSLKQLAAQVITALDLAAQGNAEPQDRS
ncbi:hypothetical protein ABPG77_008551 [Micractinium sp. CCAP 211/92]